MKCPKCNALEVDAMTPRTVYACGSSDYDQVGGSFRQSRQCVIISTARAEAFKEAESKYKADGERLDWVCRHIPGNVARKLVGDMSCTGNLDEWRSKIDEAIAHEEGKNG